MKVAGQDFPERVLRVKEAPSAVTTYYLWSNVRLLFRVSACLLVGRRFCG